MRGEMGSRRLQRWFSWGSCAKSWAAYLHQNNRRFLVDKYKTEAEHKRSVEVKSEENENTDLCGDGAGAQAQKGFKLPLFVPFTPGCRLFQIFFLLRNIEQRWKFLLFPCGSRPLRYLPATSLLPYYINFLPPPPYSRVPVLRPSDLCFWNFTEMIVVALFYSDSE